MTQTAASVAVKTARDYYNSADAEAFYTSIWGGEDIHVGLYESPQDSIYDASRRTVEYMLSELGSLGEAPRVLDIGSGYCGAARVLAKHGCQVVALNLSEVENERARVLNREQGLAAQITVVDGSFEDIPAPSAQFDLVWSQDAILHSGDRTRVMSEVARVLKPSGRFIFTDPMQADDCPEGVLQPILERIHLETLASPAFYREAARSLGLQEQGFTALTQHLVSHYSRVLDETKRRAAQLTGIDPGYLARMQRGLQHWIDGGKRGHLVWGVFRFRKA